MNKVAILYYHKISKLTTDYNQSNVNPKHFAEHMEILKENYEVVTLKDISNGTAFQRNRNAVAITFDDGYRSVLLNAVPILRNMGFGFACFVTTENVNTNYENWTDIVSRIAFEPNCFHERCNLLIEGENRDIKIGGLEERVEFYRLLQQLNKSMSYYDFKALLDNLIEWDGMTTKARSEYEIMNADELMQIVDMGGEIGAHTVTHPFLSSLSDEDIIREVNESKKKLELLIGDRITMFSYPFGDAPKRVRPILDRCGYKMALTSNVGLVTPESDLMYLPRIGVRDYSKNDFKLYMERVYS